MTSRRYELISVAILGFGHLCIMVGFDSEIIVLESVIHSVNERNPEKISKYAGYYGQAVMYIVYMIGCLFSPSIINQIGSKSILICSAICFASFPLGFFFINSYYYYFSQMLLGFGYALYYQGHGGFLTSHSTRKTISSNISVTWSIGCGCLLLAAGALAGITKLTAGKEQEFREIQNFINSTDMSNQKFERRFSDHEINLLFGVFLGASVLGILNFLVIPGKDVTDCIHPSKKDGSFGKHLKLTCSALISKKMLQLFPLFLMLGISSSFWLGLYPTAMMFDIHNANLIYLPAVFSLGIGIGEIFMGLTIVQLSRKYKDFSLQPTMVIGTVFTILSLVLVHGSTPWDASIRPTRVEPLWFYHSYPLIFILGILIGIGDCCYNSCRSVICALAMPNARPQAFSISKLYQALGSCILFFCGPIIPMYYYTIGISVLCIISTFFFFIVAKNTQKMEKNMETKMEEKQ